MLFCTDFTSTEAEDLESRLHAAGILATIQLLLPTFLLMAEINISPPRFCRSSIIFSSSSSSSIIAAVLYTAQPSFQLPSTSVVPCHCRASRSCIVSSQSKKFPPRQAHPRFTDGLEGPIDVHQHRLRPNSVRPPERYTFPHRSGMYVSTSRVNELSVLENTVESIN